MFALEDPKAITNLFKIGDIMFLKKANKKKALDLSKKLQAEYNEKIFLEINGFSEDNEAAKKFFRKEMIKKEKREIAIENKERLNRIKIKKNGKFSLKKNGMIQVATEENVADFIDAGWKLIK